MKLFLALVSVRAHRSLPPRGAWIETAYSTHGPTLATSRSPHGERGLKREERSSVFRALLSLPPRGAWIETVARRRQADAHYRRSPHGERGLKPGSGGRRPDCRSRSPHGERGLKRHQIAPPARCVSSLPPRGAWIETLSVSVSLICILSRSPHGERGLKPVMLIVQIIRAGRRSPHGERGLKPPARHRRMMN